MEPKNFKNFKFENNNYSEQNERICDFYSCWNCQGKEPPGKEIIQKLKKINKSKPQKNSTQTQKKSIAK